MTARREGPLRVLIICQYYPPEFAPIGKMLSELAADLTANGLRVTVITAFPNHPHGRVFAGYRQRLFQLDTADGIDVVRCYMYLTTRRTVPARIMSYATFAVTSLLAAIKLPRQDVLLIPSPPLTNGLIAIALSRLRGLPFVFNVQDLFPDAAVTAGVITGRRLVRALQWLERKIYGQARAITVISEGFRNNLIGKGVPAGKIGMIHNWLDSGEIAPAPRDNDFARRHGLTGKFVVLYSGTIGLISGAEVLVDCAVRLARYPDILFLLVGEGVAKDAVVSLAEQHRLRNMMFLPLQRRELLSQVQSSSDVSVVTLKRGMGRTSVPSKVLGYMAAARPVLASVDGDSDTRSFIAKADCGVWVEPGDAVALTEAILSLYRDRGRCRRLGSNGRSYLQRCCGRQAATGRYERLLRSLARVGP